MRMKIKYTAILLALLVAFPCGFLKAQDAGALSQQVVKGIVTDAAGEPVYQAVITDATGENARHDGFVRPFRTEDGCSEPLFPHGGLRHRFRLPCRPI